MPVNAEAYADERSCVLLVELEVWELPALRKARGPLVFAPQHVREFRKKYRPLGRCFVEGDRWVAEVPRRWTRAERKLADSLRDPVAQLRAKGLGSVVAPGLRRAQLLDTSGIIRLAAKDKEFARALQRFLERDIR